LKEYPSKIIKFSKYKKNDIDIKEIIKEKMRRFVLFWANLLHLEYSN